jgi:hypothetical protein
MIFPPPAIPLPPGVTRETAPLWAALVDGLRRLLAQFGAPEAAVRGNGASGSALRAALIALGRMERIARCLLVVFAARLLALDPPFAAAARSRPAARSATGVLTRNPWPSTPLLPPWRGQGRAGAQPAPAPAALVAARRDPVRTIARKMAGLTRLLAGADAAVRRMARRLKERLVRVRPRARALRGPFGEELALARDAASWALHPRNTS